MVTDLPPMVKRAARPRSTLGSGNLTCHYLDVISSSMSSCHLLMSAAQEPQVQGQSETPTPGSSNLRDDAPHGMHGMNADPPRPPRTSTLMPSRRGRSKVQKEVETDEQRIRNLVSTHLSFDEVYDNPLIPCHVGTRERHVQNGFQGYSR